MWAILPISVSIPIDITFSKAFPFNMTVPIKRFLFPLMFFSTPSDSPVRRDSFTITPLPSIIIPSAGILSPASNTIISPKVILSALTTFTLPFLYTLVVGAARFFNASKDFSVLYSCIKPNIPFITTIMSIVIASAKSPITPDIIVAPIRTQVIKSLNCDKNIIIGEIFLLFSRTFNPYSFIRLSTSSSVKPITSSFSSTILILLLHKKLVSIVNICHYPLSI